MTKEQWEAIKNRDAQYDGVFFYGFKTTKRICKPSCSTRLGKPENVVIFESVEEGLQKGYTPCRRCRPDQLGWKGSRAELADAAERYVKEHYREKFSLKEIAKALFVNENYLLRTFRAQKEMTLLEFHNRARCEAATELLTHNDLSISYISDSVGFATPSHFSRIFKKVNGCTPSEWRQRYIESLED